MPTLSQIAAFLDKQLNTHLYPNEQNGIVLPSQKQVLCLGLALEPWYEMNDWVTTEKLDGLFLHRPWKLNKASFPPGIGVLAYHLPFDEQLTIGYNVLLAQQLHMQQVQPFGEKENRPLGMIGEIREQTFSQFKQLVQDIFGSPEEWHQGKFTAITKVAAVGAMTDILIRRAAEKGAQVYITGQFRKPARQAVIETGIHVLAAGHRNSEIGGLHMLASLLQQQWPSLQIVPATHQT
jgi:putative NIF3 family GTP cyclohydrolase 1 type 2